ncbi:HlyD family secretion protein [Hyphococcus luteus]|nr:HlyD family secretion protein [Marinicaulis flavus]
MRKIILAAFLALFSAAALFAGARWAFHGRFFQETDNAYVKADAVTVSAKIANRIARVAVEENAYVNQGDPLVLLENEDYAAARRQAEAEVAARKAALESIRQQITLADAKIADAAAAIKSAKAQLTLKQLDRKRTADLADRNVAARQSLDQANAGVENWSGKLESAEAALDAAKAAALVARAQKDEAQAALKKADALYETALLNEENTVVRAPRDGVVGNLAARDGQFVSPGQRLMSLVPLNDVYVVANFKETQIEGIYPGAKATLELDAFPGEEIIGEVENFSPASGSEFSLLPPENATGNFVKIVQRVPIRIRITEAPENVTILPGLSVTASVDTRTGDREAPVFSPRRHIEESPPISVAPQEMNTAG